MSSQNCGCRCGHCYLLTLSGGDGDALLELGGAAGDDLLGLTLLEDGGHAGLVLLLPGHLGHLGHWHVDAYSLGLISAGGHRDRLTLPADTHNNDNDEDIMIQNTRTV